MKRMLVLNYPPPMFTGIIKGKGHIISSSPFIVALPLSLLPSLEIGASVAIDGVCLTVTALEETHLHFDLSLETQRLTYLGQLPVGSEVNIERAARFGEEIGGHLLSGHVGGIVTLLEKGELWTFTAPPFCAPYLFYKGFVALNGVSLTIAKSEGGTFSVAFIPETLRRTTFPSKEIGSPIHIEWDLHIQALVDTILCKPT